MYYVTKRMEIAGAHQLQLNYESKCTQLHGHNWIVTVHCKAKELNDNGMIVDFAHIKKQIQDRFDHRFINDVPPFNIVNPTAENMAFWICNYFKMSDVDCYKVEVQESEGNVAVYMVDEPGGCKCRS